VTQHIPLAFRCENILDAVLKEKLVALLSKHIGQIKVSDKCLQALCGCELVKCRDGEYRKPSKVYFDSEIVRNVLGHGVSVVQLPQKYQDW